MSRPPRKVPGSRRDNARHIRGIGPEHLPRGSYKVELVFVCRFDGTEMGRAIRYTPPDMDGETETTTTPARGSIPRDFTDGHEKWRFVCQTCGHNVPLSDARIEGALDAIFAPWARRKERVPI